MVPSQRALHTGSPSIGYAVPAQLSVLEAIMRSDLRAHYLPNKIQSLAIQKIQKGANTADLLYLTSKALSTFRTLGKGGRPCHNASKNCPNIW